MIKRIEFSNASCDLRSASNIKFCFSIFRILGLKNLGSTYNEIILGDLSGVQVESILENVLVEVGSLEYRMYFRVIKMKEESNETLIFGRPFLATTRARIGVDAKFSELQSEDGCTRETFSINKSF